MDWTSFSFGCFIGVLLGIVLLAMLQFVRERRDEGDDFLYEVEATRLARDDTERRYIERLSAENRRLVERICGEGD